MNIIKMLTKKNCYPGQNKPAYVVIHETDNWSKGANAKAHATAMKTATLPGQYIIMWIPEVSTRHWITRTAPMQWETAADATVSQTATPSISRSV